MGMDLIAVDPGPDAPLDKDGNIIDGRYNWAGWRWLMNWLDKWGVDLSQFSWLNDGEEISEATCKAVADAMETHFAELEAEVRVEQANDERRHAEFLLSLPPDKRGGFTLPTVEEKLADLRLQIRLWRTCGGYRQW